MLAYYKILPIVLNNINSSIIIDKIFKFYNKVKFFIKIFLLLIVKSSNIK